MNKIKTYTQFNEGIFDFLKKKKTVEIIDFDELEKMVIDIVQPLRDDNIEFVLYASNLIKPDKYKSGKKPNCEWKYTGIEHPNAITAACRYIDRNIIRTFLEEKKDLIEVYGLRCFYEEQKVIIHPGGPAPRVPERYYLVFSYK